MFSKILKSWTLFFLFFAWQSGSCLGNTPFWHSGFHRYGANSSVHVLFEWNGNAVISGSFSSIAGISPASVVTWNGTEWDVLAETICGEVLSGVAIGDSLVIGGDFSSVDGVSVNNVAIWDGFGWSPLGGGSDGPVKDLVLFDGGIVAAGDFSSTLGPSGSRVALWANGAWGPLGEGPFPGGGAVLAMVPYHGGLAVGGDSGVTWWKDQSWDDSLNNVCDGNSIILSMGIYNSKLVVGGTFSQYDTLGNLEYINIAEFENGIWHGLAQGLYDSPDPLQVLPSFVSDIAVFDSELVAVGYFESAYGGPYGLGGVAEWDGVAWSPMGEGVHPSENATVQCVADVDGEAFIGGDFLFAGGSDVDPPGSDVGFISRWNNHSWVPIGEPGVGIRGVVNDLELADSSLVASGRFVGSEFDSINNCGMLIEDGWSPIFSLPQDLEIIEIKDALKSTNKIYLSGWFSGNFGQRKWRVGVVEGGAFSFLGQNLPGDPCSLAFYQGELFAGGFTWDGVGWTEKIELDGVVHAFAEFNGELILGGEFLHANGEVVNSVCSWDGSSIGFLGEGITNPGSLRDVYSLLKYNDHLVMGGAFYSVDFQTSPYLAAWDGGQWQPMGWIDGENYGTCVRTLGTSNGNLVVGGRFSGIEGMVSPGLAYFDGTNWMPLSPGLGGICPDCFYQCNDVAIDGEDVWIGGEFNFAGGVQAHSISRVSIPLGETAVNDMLPTMCPESLKVHIHPNPANPRTSIQISVGKGGLGQVDIFDLRGRHISSLWKGDLGVGNYEFPWDGIDNSGAAMPSGTYLAVVSIGNSTTMGKVVLLK